MTPNAVTGWVMVCALALVVIPCAAAVGLAFARELYDLVRKS